MKRGIAPILDNENINNGYPCYIRRFASGQYLSFIAYHLASQAVVPKTINVLNEDGCFKAYHVKQIPLEKGLYGYILLPQDKNCLDVKIIWRGTEPTEPHSVQINLEEGGPAVQRFYQEKDNIFQCFFDAIREYYPDNPALQLNVCGHSQGGALSQLFVTHFLIERLDHHDYDHIQCLNMTALSSPGVPSDIAKLANEYAEKQLKANKPLKIIANFGLVEGDIIPTLGLDTIFATLRSEVALVNVLKVTNQYKDYWKQNLYWQDGLQLSEIGNMVKNTIAGFLGAHSATNYFAPVDEHGKITVNDEFKFWTNSEIGDVDHIRAELLENKAYKLQTSFYFIQKLCYDLDVLGLTNLITIPNLNKIFSGLLYYFHSPSTTAKEIVLNQNEILQPKMK